MTTTDDRPAVTITHPDWCQRERCESTPLGGAHIGSAVTYTATGDCVAVSVERGLEEEEGPTLPAIPEVVLRLRNIDYDDWELTAYLSPDDARQVAAMLLATAAEAQS